MVIFRHGSFVEKHSAQEIFTLYSGLSSRSRPGAASQKMGAVRLFTGEFCHIVLNAVFIKIIHRFKQAPR